MNKVRLFISKRKTKVVKFRYQESTERKQPDQTSKFKCHFNATSMKVNMKHLERSLKEMDSVWIRKIEIVPSIKIKDSIVHNMRKDLPV